MTIESELQVRQDAARLVKLGEILQFFGIQLDGQCLDCIFKVPLFACADDRRRNAWLMENPRQSDLRVIDAALFCDFRHPIDDGEIFRPVILPARKFIGLGANRVAIVLFAAIADNEPSG